MNSAGLNSPASNGTPRTSLEGLAATAARYVTAPLADGSTIRLRAPKTRDVRHALASVPDSRQMDALIALTLVDDNGDTLIACSEDAFAQHLDTMEWQHYASIVEAVNAFVQPPVDYAELVKNSSVSRSD